MIPNSLTRREKPDRSVNMIAQSSPNKSQIRLSMAAVSAPGLQRSSINFQRRVWLALRPSSAALIRPAYPRILRRGFARSLHRCLHPRPELERPVVAGHGRLAGVARGVAAGVVEVELRGRALRANLLFDGDRQLDGRGRVVLRVAKV